MKLVHIGPSPQKTKKMMAVFIDDFRETYKTTHFGARTYGDYTVYWKLNPDLARAKRRQYMLRHRVRENWSDPTSAGALSRYILWEKPTISEAIRAFRRRFKL